jgi:chromosome segregation ATPase
MTDAANRFDEIDARLDALDSAMTELREQLRENTAVITGLQRATSELLAIAQLHQQGLRIAQQDAERDRAEFREEIRRIWEYLLRQQPNGHGDS